MSGAEYIRTEEAAQLEGTSAKTLLRRLERKRIILANDPEDARRKLVPVSALSRNGYQEWVKTQTCAALQGINGPPQKTLCGEGNPDQTIMPAAGSAKSLQPFLAFTPPTETERMLHDAIPPAIPHRQRAYIDRWAAIVGDCTNGTWQKYHGQCLEGFTIRHNGDFIRAQAKLHGVGVSTIHQKLALLREINHNPDIPRERKGVEFWIRILPKNRPGRSGHAFFSDDENAWMREKLLSFYLT
jgi:hypothetical protein